jgi:hypothetical protein
MLVPKLVVKFDEMIGPELDAVYSYAKLMDANCPTADSSMPAPFLPTGKSSESAAAEVGKDYLVDGRTINRWRAKLKRLGKRLRESH